MVFMAVFHATVTIFMLCEFLQQGTMLVRDCVPKQLLKWVNGIIHVQQPHENMNELLYEYALGPRRHARADPRSAEVSRGDITGIS